MSHRLDSLEYYLLGPNMGFEVNIVHLTFPLFFYFPKLISNKVIMLLGMSLHPGADPKVCSDSGS